MEELYGNVGFEEKPRVFFRNRESAKDIIDQSKMPFKPWSENLSNEDMFIDLFDEPGGCSESCEPCLHGHRPRKEKNIGMQYQNN